MKRNVFILAFMAMSMMVMAQQWTGVISDAPETYRTQLISSSETSIKVNVQVPGFYTTNVTTPRGEAKIISMPKAVSTAQAGEPNLPMMGIPAIIGDQARMNIRVLDAEYMDFEGIEVAPSKGNFPRTIDPATVPYTYGECYGEDAFFPANNVGLYEPYIIRDFRGQNMVVYPFVYNPVTRTLRVYYNMTVEMYKVDDNGTNVMAARRSNTIKMDPDFKSLYQRHFINYEAAMNRYTPVDEQGDLLIICYDSFISSMTDFVNWKKTRGMNTTIVGTSAAGSSYTAIQSFIQSQYNANNNLTHVLLVGDVDQIPGYSYSGGGSSYSGLGDNAYGQIVGSDIYNDVFIGRFSAQNTTQVNTQIQKIITYERDLTTSDTWCQNGLGVSTTSSASGHYSEIDYQHVENLRTDLLNYGYSTVYQDYYNVSGYPSSSTTTISNHINSGVGIINYCNHGSETSWGSHSYSNSHVNALTNNNMLPFIISVACLNGKYDYNGDCFAETWMRATNNSTGTPTGAVGTLMSYISQPWVPPMWAQDEFVDILVESYNNNIKRTWGGAAINGLFAILDNYSLSETSAVGTYQAWILYGDPTLMLRTKTPQAMTVNHEGTLPVGTPSYTVNVSNGEGALATITDANHNIVGSATVSNGTANVSLSGTLTPGTELTLCVFGYNKVTYLGNINVIALEGPYITLDSYTPTETHVGDDTNLSLTFKNLGISATTGTTDVTLTTDDPNVTLIDYTGSFDVLAPDATTVVSGFSFSINPGVADGTNVTIHYTAVNGEDTYEGNIVVTANEAVLTYQNMVWDGSFVPGDTFTVTAKFKNTGHYQATNAVATMTTTSGNYLTISNPTITVGTLAVDQEVSCQFTVTIAANCTGTEVIPVTFTMTADGGLIGQGNETLKNACNVIFDLFDSYGDGWNGASLTVSFDDGSAPQSLTFSSGSSASYPLEIGNGTHVTLTWSSGNYDGECSFTVSYEGDLLIYQSSGTPSAGVLYAFDCNCAAASQTFMVTVASENTEYGTVSGGGEFSYGQSCTVTATPAEGYMFMGWTWNGEMLSGMAEYTFIVTSNMDLVAHFGEGVMIGDGGTATNEFLPSYSFYKYSLTQQIYTVEELGAPGMITSIAFYNGGAEKTRTLDFYMKATDKASFTGSNDWVSVIEADKLFSGVVTMTADAWTIIPLSTPFLYDGSSNVVLVTDDNSGAYTSSPHMSCRVFDAPTQAIRIYNDNTNYDPYAPTGYSGTVLDKKNQLVLTKESLGDCVRPTQLTATEVGPDFIELSWTENGAATEWVVDYSVDGVFVGQASTTMNPFTITELDSETTYEVKVRPLCDENLWSTAITVTTMEACPVPQEVEVSNITGMSAMVTWAGYDASYLVQLGVPAFLIVEDFSNGIPASWTNDASYPWTVVDGHIQSGNGGVSNSTSSISVTVTYPAAGTISFDFWSRGEGSDSNNWDKSRFYIDDELKFDYGAHSDWESYSAEVAAGSHTFTWTYKKDNSVNPTGDCFIVDNVEMKAGETVWSDPVAVEDAEYRFTGLTPETTYCVRVQGVCGDEETEWSEVVVFTTTDQTTDVQPVSLSAGNNWVSFNVEVTMADLQAALLEAYPDVEMNELVIKSKGNGQTAYNPVAQIWVGSLTTLDLSQMYMVKVPTDGEISVEGMPIDPAAHPATIAPGVNWIAFPLSESMSITDAFAGFPTNGDIVKAKSGGQAQWNSGANRWIGALVNVPLEPGQGYIYNSKATEDRTFTFPVSAK